MKAYFNWSGGKDSALAFYKAKQENKYNIDRLLTTVNEEYKRISMHGVREELLMKQAEAIGLPLDILYLPEYTSMDTYEKAISDKLAEYKSENIDVAVFGDIFLEDLRDYRENQLSKLDMKATFPLWKIKTTYLVNEFINLGFKTMVVSVDTRYLDKSFVGVPIDQNFLERLPEGVDPCGENGEFHTFVYDGPIFKKPVEFQLGEKVYREYPAPANNSENVDAYGFWYCDLIP